MLNFRYGYNWFVRGTDSNPANHDFDLTSLGFPAAYNASIPDGIRRFPRFDITGYQGTGIGGEERPNETQSFIATLNKSAGRPFDQDRHGSPPVSRDRLLLRQQPDRAVQLRLDVDARPARQLDGGAGQPRPIVRVVPAWHPKLGRGHRAASYDEKSQTWGFFVQDDWRVGSRMTVNLGLRYEFETPMTEEDNQSVRGFDCDGRAGRSRRPRARITRATRRPRCRSSSVPRPRRPDVRRRRRPAAAGCTRHRRPT